LFVEEKPREDEVVDVVDQSDAVPKNRGLEQPWIAKKSTLQSIIGGI
jgi:hypothetical protein